MFLTDLAIEKASLPSLRFLGMGDCVVGIAAILCAIGKHGIFAMCVKGVKLSSQEIACLLDLYPDIGEIGIPTLWLARRNCLSKHCLSVAFIAHVAGHLYRLFYQLKKLVMAAR